MTASKIAQKLYSHLFAKVLPTKKVVSYEEVSKATGIPLGPEGGLVKYGLDEIFMFCDENHLPPLSSIVVNKDAKYDPKGRHGMPGGGYLVTEAKSKHLFKNRMRLPGIDRWLQKPRPPDTESYSMREMIESHQNMVWDHQLDQWPRNMRTSEHKIKMFREPNSYIVYKYLVDYVVPSRQIITYGELAKKTKVPMKKDGGPLINALNGLFSACDARELPPIASLVVSKNTLSKKDPAVGIPGKGYFYDELRSPNKANRPRTSKFVDWKDNPKQKINVKDFLGMIREHHKLVWDFPHDKWPDDFFQPPDHFSTSKDGAFSCSDDYIHVYFWGEDYTNTPNQARALEYMHKNHLNGIRDQADAAILEACDLPLKSRLRDTFRDSRLWGTLIIPGERRGTRRLNLK